MPSLLSLVVVGATFSLNEAFSLAAVRKGMRVASEMDAASEVASEVISERAGMRVATKAEVMAQMTSERAVDTVMHMRSLNQKPQLMKLLQNKFGAVLKQATGSVSQLQAGLRGSAPSPGLDITYSSVLSATKMLNDLGNETAENLDIEKARCEDEEMSQSAYMEELRDSVANFNADAADARGRVLKNQGLISTYEGELETVEDALEKHERECAHTIDQLKYELGIVTSDLAVMDTVIQMIGKCPEPTMLMMMQCAHCEAPLLQRGEIHSALTSLKSDVAKQLLMNSLSEPDDEPEEEDDEPVALAQEGVSHGTAAPIDWADFESLANASVNVSDVPVAVEKVDCIPTKECKLTKNCQKLKDRFIEVQSDLVDQQDELTIRLAEREAYCARESKLMREQIDNLNIQLRDAKAGLAQATKDQNEAEAGSHRQAAQHKVSAAAYLKEMKECCDNQNDMISELCALGKIRGELNNINGTKAFINDCEVTEWRAGDCSKSCGGGTMISTRGVITHPTFGGRPCPVLEKKDDCNQQKCPIDCAVDAWSEWSECTAECGGGVKERARHVLQRPLHGGQPCEETEEEESCGMDACNVDCKLSKWTEWSQCSKACGGGTSRKSRDIDEPAKGTGICYEAESEERLVFKNCNEGSCINYLKHLNKGKRHGRDILKCNTPIDLTIMIDGSGSLGRKGWAAEINMVKTLLDNVNPMIQVAVQLFSGPYGGWKNVKPCIRDAGNVNMEKDCRIKWVSRYTNKTQELKQTVASLAWPRGSTLTSVALGMAHADLINGRDGVQSVVLVLTDGRPYSRRNTKMAAESLQHDAKVVFVPFGRRAPKKFLRKLATKPSKDHIVEIGTFMSMLRRRQLNAYLNKIITSICPDVA